MSAKQRFHAVREVVTTDYSGDHSTKTTEIVEVEVTWMGARVEWSNYSACGDWRLVSIAEPATLQTLTDAAAQPEEPHHADD